MRALLPVAATMFLCAAADAEVLSYTSVVPPTGYDAYGGQSLQVLTPGFDASLGTLDGVSMIVTGTLDDSIMSFSGDTLPFAAIFDNIGGASGYGLNESGMLSQDTGIASTFLATNGFSIATTISTNQDLADYASHAVIATGYAFFSTVTNAVTGQLVSYDSDYALFSGTVTETFTYTASAVPEPASLAFLSLGLLAVTALATRRSA